MPRNPLFALVLAMGCLAGAIVAAIALFPHARAAQEGAAFLNGRGADPRSSEAALLLLGIVLSAAALLAGLKHGLARWRYVRRFADGALYQDGARGDDGNIRLDADDVLLAGHTGQTGPVLVRMKRASAGEAYRQGTPSELAEVDDGTRRSLLRQQMLQATPIAAMIATALLVALAMACHALQCGPFGENGDAPNASTFCSPR